ncbi:MAG: UvrB/UvrC motif-containing protein [Nitrospirota bacterium]
MLCDICQKEEATIFYKEMMNNKYTEMHLCERCAGEQGVKKLQIPSAITNLLSALAELSTESVPKEIVGEKCPGCGFTYSDFRERGKLGCSQCYQSFSEPLSNILRKIHGNIQHNGKSPSTPSTSSIPSTSSAVPVVKETGPSKEITVLRQALDAAIKKEEYEEAAKLRDQIRALEKEVTL